MADFTSINPYVTVKTDNIAQPKADAKLLYGLNIYDESDKPFSACNRSRGFQSRTNVNIGINPEVDYKFGVYKDFAAGRSWYSTVVGYIGASAGVEKTNSAEKQLASNALGNNNGGIFRYDTEAVLGTDVTVTGFGYNAGNFDGYIRAGVQAGVEYDGLAQFDSLTAETSEMTEKFVEDSNVGGKYNAFKPILRPYIEGQACLVATRGVSVGLFGKAEMTMPMNKDINSIHNYAGGLTAGVRVYLY